MTEEQSKKLLDRAEQLKRLSDSRRLIESLCKVRSFTDLSDALERRDMDGVVCLLGTISHEERRSILNSIEYEMEQLLKKRTEQIEKLPFPSSRT